jgi:hypothetical protein
MRVQSADMRPSHTTRAEIGIAQSARPMHVIAGSKRGKKNCSPRARSTWSLPCLVNYRLWHLQNKREIYALLFRASAATLLEVARDPKHLGAEIGFFSVLHTWNQKLLPHPHVHCVVPAGGLAPDHSRWIDSQQKFFLPVGVLKKVFCGKFVDGLKTLHAEHKLAFQGTLAALQNPRAFAAWLRPLFRSSWVVYSKPPFGGAQHALRYLGQYTHRVAISNHRLVALADGRVTFRWRDSAHKKVFRTFGAGQTAQGTCQGKTRALRSANPARPYICRLIALSRLICPSTGPLLQGVVIESFTASQSRRSLLAN